MKSSASIGNVVDLSLTELGGPTKVSEAAVPFYRSLMDLRDPEMRRFYLNQLTSLVCSQGAEIEQELARKPTDPHTPFSHFADLLKPGKKESTRLLGLALFSTLYLPLASKITIFTAQGSAMERFL